MRGFSQHATRCAALTACSYRYLHLGFKASAHIVQRSRVCTVWAILRIRHPMLCARVEMRDYDDVGFMCVMTVFSCMHLLTKGASYSYNAPASPEDAYHDADAQLEYRIQSSEGTLLHFSGVLDKAHCLHFHRTDRCPPERTAHSFGFQVIIPHHL